MIDDKSEAGAWQRELDQRPKCAHSVVRYRPSLSNGTGNNELTRPSWYERWVCDRCGQEFMPKVSP